MGDGAACFDRRQHAVSLGVAEDGGFDAGEGEVEAGGRLKSRSLHCGSAFGRDDRHRCGFGRDRAFGRAVFDGREGEGDGAGVAVGGEAIDPGAAGVAEAEELGDLVEGFAGGVVDGAADVAVVPGASLPCLLVSEVEVGVASGDDEGEERSAGVFGREEGGVVHEDGVDVAFEVVDADEGLREGEGEGFGVGDADEEGSGETGAAGDGYGVEIFEADAGLGDGGAGDGDDVAEVLAGGELGDDAPEVGVESDLAGDHVGEGFGAVANDGGCGLVAGALDAENEAEAGAGSCGCLGHLYSLGEVWGG